MKMRKKMLAIFHNIFVLLSLTVLLSLLLTGTVFAESNIQNYQNDDTDFSAVILDQADLLSESEELTVLEEMKRVTGYSTAIFVTSEKAHSSDIEQYARSLMESVCGSINMNGYTAVIFVIDMYSRELVIYSGETVFKTISTGIANSITDNVYRYAGTGDYEKCAKEAFAQIYKVLNGEKIAQPMRYITAALLSIFAGLAVCFIIVRAKTRKLTGGADLQSLAQLRVHAFNADVNSRLIDTRKVRHVESHNGPGGGRPGGGGHFGGGGFSGGGFSGGGHSGGFSGHGGGGSHKF